MTKVGYKYIDGEAYFISDYVLKREKDLMRWKKIVCNMENLLIKWKNERYRSHDLERYSAYDYALFKLREMIEESKDSDKE